MGNDGNTPGLTLEKYWYNWLQWKYPWKYHWKNFAKRLIYWSSTVYPWKHHWKNSEQKDELKHNCFQWEKPWKCHWRKVMWHLDPWKYHWRTLEMPLEKGHVIDMWHLEPKSQRPPFWLSAWRACTHENHISWTDDHPSLYLDHLNWKFIHSRVPTCMYVGSGLSHICIKSNSCLVCGSAPLSVRTGYHTRCPGRRVVL